MEILINFNDIIFCIVVFVDKLDHSRYRRFEVSLELCSCNRFVVPCCSIIFCISTSVRKVNLCACTACSAVFVVSEARLRIIEMTLVIVKVRSFDCQSACGVVVHFDSFNNPFAAFFSNVDDSFCTNKFFSVCVAYFKCLCVSFVVAVNNFHTKSLFGAIIIVVNCERNLTCVYFFNAITNFGVSVNSTA